MIDTPDYPGRVEIDFDGLLTFTIFYDHGRYSGRTPGTRVGIGGHCCGADITDDQARDIHAALGRYLADRNKTAPRETGSL